MWTDQGGNASGGQMLALALALSVSCHTYEYTSEHTQCQGEERVLGWAYQAPFAALFLKPRHRYRGFSNDKISWWADPGAR